MATEFGIHTDLPAGTVVTSSEKSPTAQGGYEHADAVDHPPHYCTAAGIESIDVIEAFGLGFHAASAVKYILRAGKKPNTPKDQDIEKAIWYLRRWLEHANR